MKKVRLIAVLLILIGAAFFVQKYHLSEKGPQRLVLYGNVDQRQVDLAFLDAERVAEVLVQEGMTVSPGQIVARLETRRLRDRIAIVEARLESANVALNRLKNGTRPEEIDQARAAVASAKAEASFADAQYERYQTLSKSNTKAVSAQDVDNALRQRSVAHAKLNLQQKALRLAEIGPRTEDIAQAKAVLLEHQRNLEQLQHQLGDAELKSPAHAVVNRRLLEPGDMASPQRAVLSLAVLSPKWVRAYISEVDLGYVRPGMDALVMVDSHPDAPIRGTVGFVSSVAEFTPKTVETPELRTSLVYEIRIIVDDPDDRLRIGMPATVRFPDL